MKLCMIGVRGHFSMVLDGLKQLPDVSLAGIATGSPDEDIGRLVKWCHDNNRTPAQHRDWRKMLDEEKPDLLCVCGPFEQHAAMCIEGFRRGMHVFSEKPVAVSLEELERLHGEHRKSGVHFVAMMGMRYEAPFNTAWRLVQQGAIGSVRMISVRKSYKLGTREPFYRKRETYSGTIPWVGSHAIDLVKWFSGEEFVSVCAVQSTMDNRGHGELEMTCAMQFYMTSEVLASVTLDYLRPASAPTHGDDRIRVAGTSGVIEVRGDAVYLIDDKEPGERSLQAWCDRQIFADFVEHIHKRSQAWLTPEDTFTVARASLLARQSADEKRIVHF